MPDSISDPAAPVPLTHPVRASAVTGRKPVRFDLAPDAAMRARIADYLGLLALPALRFRGEIAPAGRHDAALHGHLTASADQPCILTLAPVRAEIDVPVERRYLADMDPVLGDDAEIPEDTDAEPLPDTIDAGAVAVEALALALPLYPRADGASLAVSTAEPPGEAPIRDDDLKPFAGLAGLKARLTDRDPDPH